MIIGLQTYSIGFQELYMCSIKNTTSANSLYVSYSSLSTRCYEMLQGRFPALLRHHLLRTRLASPI